jgi:hypothetical protein
MAERVARAIMAAVLFAIGAAAAIAQPGQPEQPEQPGVAAALPAWIAPRLAQLEPDDPAGYFLLGEEVIADLSSREEEELATQLFSLAYELDRADGTPTWIAPSSCIALASIARLETEERWLRALASRLDPEYAAPAWQLGPGEDPVSEAAVNAAEAVGEARAGEGLQARDLLEKPGVRELISRYGRLLGFSASSGALWQVEQWATEWPCRECGNERVVFRPDTDPPSYRECYTCRGNPGPRLTGAQLVNQLRFESRLLQGISRSWGAQLALDYAAPLRDPDPDELAEVMGVDAGLPYWRGGWVGAPDGVAPPAPERAPDAPTLDSPPDR